MRHIVKSVEWLNRISLYTAGAFIFISMILIVQDVVMRYFFNSPSMWVLDITRFMLCYIVFLGMSPALREGSHVSVDLFLEFCGQKARRWLGLVSHIAVVLFSSVFLWTLTMYTLQAFMDNRVSPTSVPIPMKWIYVIGPLGMLLFLITAILQLYVYLYKWGKSDVVITSDLSA